VLAQSPAERAGLQIGDQVLSVDGYKLEHIEKALNFQKFPSLQPQSSTLFGDQKKMNDFRTVSSPSSSSSPAEGDGGSVWGTMRGLFSVPDVRSRYNTAIAMRMVVRQKQLIPIYGHDYDYCDDHGGSGDNDDDGSGKRLPRQPPSSRLRYVCVDPISSRNVAAASIAPKKIVTLKPDFTYLDGEKRVLHSRLG